MDKKWHFNFGYLLFAWIAILLLQQYWTTTQKVEVAPYMLARAESFRSQAFPPKRVPGRKVWEPPVEVRVDDAVAATLEDQLGDQ